MIHLILSVSYKKVLTTPINKKGGLEFPYLPTKVIHIKDLNTKNSY